MLDLNTFGEGVKFIQASMFKNCGFEFQQKLNLGSDCMEVWKVSKTVNFVIKKCKGVENRGFYDLKCEN